MALRLQRIIEKNGWDKSSFDFLDDLEPFDLIKRVLDKLNGDEISLFLNLLDDYLVVREYRALLLESLQNLFSSFPEDTNFCFSQVLDGKGQPKSSASVNYELKSLKHRFDDKYNLEFYDNPRNREFAEWNGVKVFVDDFIGTGDQFVKMLQEMSRDGFDIDSGAIVCIAIQEEAKYRLENDGYTVLSSHVRSKSLKKLNQKDDFLFDPYELNLSIAEKVPLPALLSLGYGDSEATVTLKRTPDNTLPIFSDVGGGKKWPAIFPR